MAELTGGIGSFDGGVSTVQTTPFSYRPGTRAVDLDGNIYVFVDYVGTVYGGLPVQIYNDFTAAQIGITGRGPLGVACGYATSDNGGWVQIYGSATMQIGVAGTSPSDAANGPTTVQTSGMTFFVLPTSATTLNVLGLVSDTSSLDTKYQVRGITVAQDVTMAGHTSAVCDGTSHTGSQIKVFLNFPSIEYVQALYAS